MLLGVGIGIGLPNNGIQAVAPFRWKGFLQFWNETSSFHAWYHVGPVVVLFLLLLEALWSIGWKRCCESVRADPFL